MQKMQVFEILWLLVLVVTIQSGLVVSQTGIDRLKNIDRVAGNLIGSLVRERVTPASDTTGESTTAAADQEILDLSEPSDTIIIFDRSPSVSSYHYNRSTKFAKELIRRSMIISGNHTRLAIITFAGSVTVHFDHISDLSRFETSCELFSRIGSWKKLHAAFNSSDPGSQIRKAFETADGIFTVGKNLRENIKQTIWLLTDAEHFDDEAFKSSEVLRRKGIRIFGVGVGGFLNVGNLKKVVSDPVNKHCKRLSEWEIFFKTNLKEKNESMVSPIFAKLSHDFCASQNYYCDSQTSCYCDVSHSVQLMCTCRPGYYRKNNTCHACPPNTFKMEGGDGPCQPCEFVGQHPQCQAAPSMMSTLMWIFVAVNVALFLILVCIFVYFAVRRWKNRPVPKDVEQENHAPTSNSIYTQTYGLMGPDIIADVRYTTESPWNSNTNLIRTHKREDSDGYMKPISSGAQGRINYLTTGAKTFSPDGAKYLASKKLNHSYINEGAVQTISDNANKKKALKLPAFANLREKFRKNKEYENEDVINSLSQSAPAPEHGEDSQSDSPSATASRLESSVNRGQGRPLVAKGKYKSKAKKSKKSRKYQNEYVIESLKRNSKIDTSPTEDVQSILNKFEKSPNSGATRSPVLRKKNVKRLQEANSSSTYREPSYLSIHPPSEMDYSAAEAQDNEPSDTDTIDEEVNALDEGVNAPTTDSDYVNASTIEKARRNKP